MSSRTVSVLVLICTLILTGVFVACGSSGGSSTTLGKVNVSLSDPPTCAGPTGAFSHIYVTIQDVQIHQSSSAGPNDPGWVDLTPDLKTSPQQVDLLGIANNQCFLAMLGSSTELQAGTYQQIRVILSNNVGGNKGSANPCSGNTGNCVVLAADDSVHPLDLSSESQTGIKIPSGQLTGGKFTIANGEVKDLNIDFDACASIVASSGGHFRLKPVLHAGEMALTSTSLTGTLVDSATNAPISGGKAVVALEQKDANGTDRVIMQVTPDSNGNFVLCPVPAGTYDVVAVAVSGTNVAYATTITTGVQPGTSLGKIPMIAQTGTSTADASITGTVTTAGGTGTDDISLYALQTVSLNSSNVNVIIPLAQQGTSTAALSTSAGTVTYTVAVPAMWPNVGAFTSGGTTYTQSAVTPVSYSVGAMAFVPMTGGTQACSQPEVTVNTLSGGGPINVTAGGTATAATIDFTGCQ